MISKSKAMIEVMSQIERVADSNVSVLIYGESGSGKEVVSNQLHQKSSRRGRPFVAVNCAAIPTELVESELFGCIAGAFTGAVNRNGIFSEAHTGTLLLDEITEMPFQLQSKLLRAIQTKTYVRVGESIPRAVDIRFVSTTNREVHKALGEGVLREDLYYRLSTVKVNMPPLRERKEDIRDLVMELSLKHAKEMNRPNPNYSGDAMEIIENFPWPGNVRQLESEIQRLILMTNGAIITRGDLQPLLDDPVTGCSLEDLERRAREAKAVHGLTLPERTIRNLMIDVMEATGGNIKKSAEIMGMGRQTFYNKMKQFGLKRNTAEEAVFLRPKKTSTIVDFPRAVSR